MTNSTHRRVAIVTGGSRGVGADTARALSARGYDVAITYRNKEARAAAVVTAIEQQGTRGLAIGSDVTSESDRADLIEQVVNWGGGIDLLVLNASGGMERDLVAADPNYPMVINRDAQVALVQAARPSMRKGGAICFVTSHWAHRYGTVEQIPAYEPVAASKHAGEQALRALQDELTAEGIRLVVVTGDIIDGTITAKLLERVAPGLSESRRETVGAIPTTVDFGEAVAAASTDASLPSGTTIVIGGALDSI